MQAIRLLLAVAPPPRQSSRYCCPRPNAREVAARWTATGPGGSAAHFPRHFSTSTAPGCSSASGCASAERIGSSASDPAHRADQSGSGRSERADRIGRIGAGGSERADRMGRIGERADRIERIGSGGSDRADRRAGGSDGRGSDRADNRIGSDQINKSLCFTPLCVVGESRPLKDLQI